MSRTSKSRMLPELLEAGPLDEPAEAAPVRRSVLISGTGENGLNLARLSTAVFCTIVAFITVSVAFLVKPGS